MVNNYSFIFDIYKKPSLPLMKEEMVWPSTYLDIGKIFSSENFFTNKNEHLYIEYLSNSTHNS